MHLRTRLFIWIGSLFAIAFLVSYVLEIYLTRSSLESGEKNLKESILEMNEVQRQHVQTYLERALGDFQSKVNALLTQVRDYPPYRLDFTHSSSSSGTDWLNAATILMTNTWIDLIQTEKNGQITALIAADAHKLDTISSITTEEGINVLFDSNGHKYIGIPLVIEDLIPNIPPIKDPFILNAVSFFVLFDQRTIENFDLKNMKFKVLNLSINPLEPFLRWIEVKGSKSPFQYFMQHLEAAQKALRADPNFLQKVGASSVAKVPTSPVTETEKVLNKLDELGLIWGMTTLLASGPFGGTPFGAETPLGIARVDPSEATAKVIFNHQVFYSKLLEDEVEVPDGVTGLQDEIKVLKATQGDKYYFGNTLELKDALATTYLTVGIDGLSMQKDLTLVLGKMTFFIADDKVLSVLSKEGVVRADVQLTPEQVESIITSGTNGYIDILGERYYFIKMSVKSGSMFHFVVLTPDIEEFSFVRQLDQDVQIVIQKISWQMRITALIALAIVLLILSDLSKKITEPIAILASATTHVKKGHLDKAELPKCLLKSKDEVYMLYQSFNEMISGLKETEKVRAVLNKVVSPEIANEFLKQDPILGGEEKIVTVLFGDIRSFTHLTEKMPPQEVIKLLNTCMTIVSHVIDQFHGVIDKYVGDEVMGLFGAPISRDTSTIDAVSSAIEMVKALDKWNKERKTQGLSSVEMGFGIHTGQVVAGNMGAENRLNYTVLGSNVNLTARLCSIAKPMEILITESVYELPSVKEKFLIEPLSAVELRGFSSEIKIYKVLGYKL